MTQRNDGLPKPDEIKRLFGRRGALIGMLHLLPLPGAPRYVPADGMAAVVDQALAEARTLEECGFDGVIIENGWDIPFSQAGGCRRPGDSGRAASRRGPFRQVIDLPIGVNCLANAAHVYRGRPPPAPRSCGRTSGRTPTSRTRVSSKAAPAWWRGTGTPSARITSRWG